MINLIPVPSEQRKLNGYYKLGDKIKIKSEFELALIKSERADDASIIVRKNDMLDDEAYTLEISENKIEINASGEIGAYYAFQSLRQLSRYELGERQVECCYISDKPKYKCRGLQLDESRHFFGKDYVKKLLDTMFMMKLNVFHWHLTDDQGWRIEIKKYPLLTEIGSKRDYTQVGGWGSRKIINEKHSGYYTHDDIKEIVSYAMQRGIIIVPEFDFPAHCAAALAAYPQMACRELKREVPGYFGSMIPEKVNRIKDWNRPICPGKDGTIDFIKGIIDEVPKNEWKKCPHCQKRIKDNRLKDEEDLQGWLNNQILSHLKKYGKRLIGWNEILKAETLDKSIIAQYWTPKKDRNINRHASSGGNLILSNHQSFYFDMTYGQYSLKNTYDYSPEKFGIKAENFDKIMGVEGEVWTEWIDSAAKLEYNLHPRMEALAEVAWSKDVSKNWKSFKHRLDEFKAFYDYLGINYAVDEIALPKSFIKKTVAVKKFYNGDTHYEFKLNQELKQ